MVEETQELEHHLVAIFEKLESARRDGGGVPAKVPMQVEIRTLQLWKAVISECLASFVYIFIVCGAASGSTVGSGATISSMLLSTSLASGLSMTFLNQFFRHVSGAHVNPAVSIAMAVVKRISLLRTCMFVLAQCGGGIAGAAFLYGVTIPGYHGNLAAEYSGSMPSWEKFGVEFTLTFIVVYSYFVSMDTFRKFIGSSSFTIGATYAACSFVYMPHMNPARSLGPSFVLHRWDNHWVYWIGPLLGGIASGLTYEYIFNPSKQKKATEPAEDESSSIHSDEEVNYDDLDKPQAPKFHGSNYNTYRSASGVETRTNYCPSLYSAPPTKLERVESLYGGTKSLYCKSPPLTRANLNRSQSVYTKSNTAVNRDLLPKPGPLVPAQSLYPMRLNPQNHVQTQNAQNQMQQRSESYGVRGVTPGTTARTDNYASAERQRDNYSTAERQRRDNYTNENPYGTRPNPPQSSPDSGDNQSSKPNRATRPESMYGMLGSQQRSYVQKPSGGPYTGPPEGRVVSGGSSRPQNPPVPSPPGGNSYHHQHSPNSQY